MADGPGASGPTPEQSQPESVAATSTASGGLSTVLIRLAGFAILPLLALVMPLLLLPTIGTIVGSAGWASALAGQAVGTIASVVVLWGWNVDGTVQIAQATDADVRGELYARSVRTRLLLCLVVIPLAAGASALLASPGHASDAVAMAVAYALMGLSPAWFCIGAGRPELLGWYDTLPRFIATLASALLLAATRELWIFPALTAIATASALVAFHRRFARGRRWTPWPLRVTVGDLAQQRHTAGISLSGQVYAMTPTPIAQASNPLLAGPLATTDTLYRLGLFAAVALGNAFQGWTLEPGAQRRRRHRTAIAAHVVLGLAGIVALVIVGPPVSVLLSGGAAPATPVLCLAYGLAFAFLSVATPLIRNVLIPAGRQPLVFRVTVVAAVIGLAAMLSAGLSGWLEGIAFGMAASELAMLLMLVRPASRVLRDMT